MTKRIVVVFLATLLVGCATTRYPDGSINHDPVEGSNRGVFSFNRGLDEYVLEPVADGWAFITPNGLVVAFDRFFTNLKFPVRFLTNLGQGEIVQSGAEVGRFIVNTTIGILGFFDLATPMGIGFYEEDFGQMFGRWGIPSGAYWMVPIVGPSSPRDLVGFFFDSVFNLLPWFGTPVALVNSRAIAAPQIDLAEETALDYYVFVRDAYIQRRNAQVLNTLGDAAGSSDELYEIDRNLMYEVEIDEQTDNSE